MPPQDLGGGDRIEGLQSGRCWQGHFFRETSSRNQGRRREMVNAFAFAVCKAHSAWSSRALFSASRDLLPWPLGRGGRTGVAAGASCAPAPSPSATSPLASPCEELGVARLVLLASPLVPFASAACFATACMRSSRLWPGGFFTWSLTEPQCPLLPEAPGVVAFAALASALVLRAPRTRGDRWAALDGDGDGDGDAVGAGEAPAWSLARRSGTCAGTTNGVRCTSLSGARTRLWRSSTALRRWA
jgi:hypothetical protein